MKKTVAALALGLVGAGCADDSSMSEDSLVLVASVDPTLENVLLAPASARVGDMVTVTVLTSLGFCENRERLDFGVADDEVQLIPYHRKRIVSEGQTCIEDDAVPLETQIEPAAPGILTLRLYGRNATSLSDASEIIELTKTITVE